jgi:hypothetical protein
VTWFGSQGIHAYDFKGQFLWKVDLAGRHGGLRRPLDRVGPASSPIWNDLVMSVRRPDRLFLLALEAQPEDSLKAGHGHRREERLRGTDLTGRNWCPMLQTVRAYVRTPERSCGGWAQFKIMLRHPSLP